jgi:hypothetical protein
VYKPSIITHHPQKTLKGFLHGGKGKLSNPIKLFRICGYNDTMCPTIFPSKKPIMVFLGLKVTLAPSKC